MSTNADFYEEDEPVEEIVRIFNARPKSETGEPARGWTFYLGPDWHLSGDA